MKFFEGWFSKSEAQQEAEKKASREAVQARISSLEEHRKEVELGMEMEVHRDDAKRLEDLDRRINEAKQELEELEKEDQIPA